MLTEDYCGFETAKLLKEKGFNEECYQKYDSEGYLSFNHIGYINSEKCCDDFCALAPTLQMAMKWLRDIYGLHIWVEYSRFDFNNERPYLWNIVETKIDGCYWGGSYHKRPETAVEAAIKYCLENLIK